MNLFINADRKYDNGWYGYNFVINRSRDGNKASVEAFKDSWATERIGTAEFSVKGNIIQIKVAKALLGITDSFEFKWADDSVDDGDIMKFIDMGDAAPNDRFNYVFVK